MIYKEYGMTGKKVSAIGFGGMRFLPGEYKKDIKISAELILKAYEKGVTYFDTAPGYCDDRSEAICGEAFRQMEYGKFFVSTKCGLWNATDADGARRMIEKSLKTLRVPKITFYNLWCIKNLDEYKKMTKKGGIYDGILKAKEEGLIEHICCSAHATGDDIAEIINDGRIEGVTLGYNAVNFSYRRAGVVAAHAAKRGVVIMNPLGGGLIPKHPERFSFLTEGSSDSIAVSALKFLIAQDEVTVALPGISTEAELNEVLLAAENLPKVDSAYLDALSKKLGSELNMLCTGCAYCDECPENIPIPKLMESYNESILANDDTCGPTFSRLSNHWGISSESSKRCTGCGKCESLCTQKLPIIERMNKIASLR